MVNPFEIYKQIRVENSTPLTELELETIASGDWSAENECKAALLYVFKNTDTLLVDPIAFSRVALALFGIEPDFEELEPLTSEIINPVLDLILKISNDNKLSFAQISDDLLGYLAICCLEEGLWFVENHLSILQPKILELAKIAYTEIPETDLLECAELWKKYKYEDINKLSDKTPNEHQVLTNKLIYDYTNLLHQF